MAEAFGGGQRQDQAAATRAQSLALSGPAIPDGPSPLNRSQKPIAISNITIGTSNHDRPTTFAKPGETRYANAQITHHADEITPNAANARGTYLDLNHK